MRRLLPRRLFVSPVPSVVRGPVTRFVAVKRVGRLRLNWFAIGTVFGIGLSIAVNLLVTAAVSPSSFAPKVADTPSRGVLVSDARASLPAAPAAPTVNPPPSDPRTASRREPVGDKTVMKDLTIAVPEAVTVDRPPMKEAFTAAKAPPKTGYYRGFGVIRSSLFQGGADAGIPASTMHEVARAFSYDVDFQRDIHPGDTIEVLIHRDQASAAKGKATAKTAGVLQYAALTLRGQKHEIFRFKGDNGYAWYDAKGKSIKKSLLTTPVSVAHITSGFGMREHPLLGYTRFHRGVDFGASQGTPILAAGDGVVAFKGWKSGYGNFVVIKHNNTYETAYGHISRYGKIQVGSRVKQGQVIAYVGMTGMATGPHLHYEVRMNDTQVNPTARQFNLASGLTGKQLAKFKLAKAEAVRQLAALAKSTQVASR